MNPPIDLLTGLPAWEFPAMLAPTCRLCGCTDDDCRGCIERTGAPCYWIEADLCSACAELILSIVYPAAPPEPLRHGLRVRIADRVVPHGGRTGTVVREFKGYIGHVPAGLWLVDIDPAPGRPDTSEYFVGDLLTALPDSAED